MMQLDKEKRESMIRFMMVLMIFGFAIFLKNYLERMESYNTTILAFTYQYGFISRGFLGTAYLLLDKLLPWNLMKYKMVLRVTVIATSIFMMLFYWFIWICMKRCSRKYLVNLQYCFLFLTISVVSMFYSKRNLGRPDVYMLFLTLICVILVIYEKAEFLLVPASAICVMMHQGYVFMFFNILLVLLAIRILETTGRRRRYYIWILGLSFVICSGLFVYFEFFSHGGGEEIYDSIVSVATELSRGGKYHETLIAHEILGVDLFETEWPQHISNFIELPLYLLCMSPYLVLGVRYMRRVLRAADSRQKKLSYWLLILGGGTLLPDFILKIDFFPCLSKSSVSLPSIYPLLPEMSAKIISASGKASNIWYCTVSHIIGSPRFAEYLSPITNILILITFHYQQLLLLIDTISVALQKFLKYHIPHHLYLDKYLFFHIHLHILIFYLPR